MVLRKSLSPVLVGLTVFLIQLILIEYLTIRGIRPDFLLVFLVYIAMRNGSMAGVICGFVFGLIEDQISAGSMLGLAPLTKVITGFLIGRLQGKFQRMNPLVFHLVWITILLFHFFFYVYVRFQSVFESSQPEFWITWCLTVSYTLVFIGIMQVIMPLHKIQVSK